MVLYQVVRQEEIHHVEHIPFAQRRTTTRHCLLGALRLYPEGDASADRGAEPECQRASARWPTPGHWANVAANLIKRAYSPPSTPHPPHYVTHPTSSSY